MPKKDNDKGKAASAKERARAYRNKADSDGKLSSEEIDKSVNKYGVSMDKVANRSARKGIAIDKDAQKSYGLSQGKNPYRVDYTPGGPAVGSEDWYMDALSPGRRKAAGPEVQERGVYAGVDKSGKHVYRYGTGQPRVRSTPAEATNPQPASTPPPGNGEDSKQNTNLATNFVNNPPPDPTGGRSWGDYMSGSSASSQSPRFGASAPAAPEPPASPNGSMGSAYDPNNPNIYGAIAERGQYNAGKFDQFVRDAGSLATRQAWESSNILGQALSGLKVPKLDNPLSKKTANKYNRFYDRIDVG